VAAAISDTQLRRHEAGRASLRGERPRGLSRARDAPLRARKAVRMLTAGTATRHREDASYPAAPRQCICHVADALRHIQDASDLER
jgi:hypothetical protein